MQIVTMRVCVCVFASKAIDNYIYSDVIRIPYNWLNKFYSCYMASVAVIVNEHGVSIDMCHENQPNKS